jgi:hypothetical protein
MHYEQQSLSHSADPVPTLLTVDHAVFAKRQSWIGEHPRRSFQNRCLRASSGSTDSCPPPIRSAYRYT